MGKVLIIGAGGVGTVVAHKVAKNRDVFTDIMIASRTKSKCDAIVKAIGDPTIKTAQVDADNVDELVELFNSFKPEIVMLLILNIVGSGLTKSVSKRQDLLLFLDADLTRE